MTSELDRQIESLRRCETIKEVEVKALCNRARDILIEESNVQNVDAPVTVNFFTLICRFAETSTASFTISWGFSEKVGSAQRKITSSWVTSLTEGFIPLKPFYYF